MLKNTDVEIISIDEKTEDILNKANAFIKQMENTISNSNEIDDKAELKIGVDLGTCNIVITVLDKDNMPIAAELYPASVVKDGIVVEYLKAVTIVRELKSKLEKTLNRTLDYAATAIPPGINIGIAMSSVR
jgi:ethanolamine utilization protein EutJ